MDLRGFAARVALTRARVKPGVGALCAGRGEVL